MLGIPDRRHEMVGTGVTARLTPDERTALAVGLVRAGLVLDIAFAEKVAAELDRRIDNAAVTDRAVLR